MAANITVEIQHDSNVMNKAKKEPFDSRTTGFLDQLKNNLLKNLTLQGFVSFRGFLPARACFNTSMLLTKSVLISLIFSLKSVRISFNLV